MAKKPNRPTKAKPAGRKPGASSRQTTAKSTQPLLPGWTQEEQRAFLDPLREVDPHKQLRDALDAVGIDIRKPCQPATLLRQGAGLVTARTDHSEQLALAVAHAEDARACSAGKLSAEDLRQEVLCTLYLRRNLPLPSGLRDDRTPLIMDGETVGLVQPGDDARSTLVTVKLPRVVVDRLRDAVAALQPTRTMAGIVSLGVSMVLDALEAQVIRQTGQGFPKRATAVLEGGRPSRTTATTAARAPTPAKPRKVARRGHKHP